MRETQLGRYSVRLAVATAALTALAACGSSTHNNAGSGSGGGGGALKTESTSMGTVLAASNGHTIYMLTSDKSGHLACTGGCLGLWPPVTISGSVPSSPSGITFGTVSRGGSKQLTVNGHPAYTYSGDSGAGQTHGENIKSFGGTWYAFSSSGSMITHMGASPSSSSSSGGGGYGGGY
jgi:predicted lipoprotein with Yx(FWY)xxD motif